VEKRWPLGSRTPLSPVSLTCFLLFYFLSLARRHYADPDFKTPEQYEKEKWAALMAAPPTAAAQAVSK
jgi:hypothetical protein